MQVHWTYPTTVPTVSIVSSSELLQGYLQEHRDLFPRYLQYRTIRSGCHSEAAQLAGDKPVTDTYLDRAVEQKYGHEVLEEGKVLFHRLQFLDAQIRGIVCAIALSAH